jgi:DnaJ homolog subfamily C member 19
MLFLLLGAATLVVLMMSLGMFSRAQVSTLKSFAIWLVAIGGLLLAALLFLTGRGGSAIAAIIMLGPLVWSWLKPHVPTAGGGGARPGGATATRAGMSREEALAVLGLAPGASEEQIRAAHRRLMRMAHPDSGGSDWLASRVNQARDRLLG